MSHPLTILQTLDRHLTRQGTRNQARSSAFRNSALRPLPQRGVGFASG